MSKEYLDVLLGPLGLLAFLLIAVVWGGRARWWVFGWVLDKESELRQEALKDRDYWRGIAVKSLNVGQSAVDAAVKVAPEKSLDEMAKVVDQARLEGRLR